MYPIKKHAPSRDVLRQIQRLDRKYLSGNMLSFRELQYRKVIWITSKNSVVAYLILESHSGIYRIRSVCVVPEFRGNGFGKKLVKAAIRMAKRNKIAAIHTYTALHNIQSMNMLIGQGFRVSSTRYYEKQWWVHFKYELPSHT